MSAPASSGSSGTPGQWTRDRPLAARMRAYGVEVRIVVESVFSDVGRVKHGLGGDQAERLQVQPFFLAQKDRSLILQILPE